ncbi:MAG: hypothetical protein LBS99_07340 [Clostridiales bacterium]|jgi:hypothetical protein|nr:hypothetical protein [Clostridiales bacterium]
MENLLTAYVESREYVDRDELTGLFGNRYTVPDYDTLSERYIASRIARTLSAFRDGENRRMILAARCRDGIKYVCVASCKNAPLLKNIKRRITNDIDGQTASLKKVRARLREIKSAGKDG